MLMSAYLSLWSRSSKIGQSQENCNRIKFGAQSPSKDQIYDKMHPITLVGKRNLQNTAIFCYFFRQKNFNPAKIVSALDLSNNFNETSLVIAQ